MSIEIIEIDFRRKVGETIRLAGEGINRFRVFTPFLFEDGDHLAIVLKREPLGWVLSDEGHTYMHLTYDLDEKDLQKGNRQKIVSNALSAFSSKTGRANFGSPFRGNDTATRSSALFRPC